MPSAPTLSRRPDIEPGSDVLAAIELMRPVIVRETGEGRFECVGNVEVFDWLVDLSTRPRRAERDQKIRVVVVPTDALFQDLLQKVEQHVMPLLFGHLTYRQQRDEKRELRGAGIRGLSTRSGRRTGRPLVRQD